MDTVDVIAAGYEWVCPNPECDYRNLIIEIPSNEKVTCHDCGVTYTINPPEHAHQH